MGELPDAKTDFTDDLTHHFAPGCYVREFYMAAGELVVGKIHKHAHITVLLSGTCTLSSEFSNSIMTGPKVLVGVGGEKRAVYAHTASRWLTVHPTDETDLEKIEDHVIAPSYRAFDDFLELQDKSFPRRLLVHGKQLLRKIKSDQVSMEK